MLTKDTLRLILKKVIKMVKYDDLNLAPTNNFNNLLPEEAFCSFISNEVVWINPSDASKHLTLKYDKNHQILKIVHQNFSIKITDFTT